jgi:adenine-specific DNA methylase
MENIKRTVGRPKKYNSIEEFKEMKSDVMTKLKESGYFKEYYQQKKTKMIKCKHCGMDNLNSINMSNHVKTMSCRKARGEVVVDLRGKTKRKSAPKNNMIENIIQPDPDVVRDKLQVYEINIDL